MPDDNITQTDSTPLPSGSAFPSVSQLTASLDQDDSAPKDDEPTDQPGEGDDDGDEGQPADNPGDDTEDEDEDEDSNEDDAGDNTESAFVDEALAEYLDANEDRRKEIAKGIKKKADENAEVRKVLDGWNWLEQTATKGSPDEAKQAINLFLAEVAKVRGVELSELIGVAPETTAGPFDPDEYIKGRGQVYDEEIEVAQELGKIINDKHAENESLKAELEKIKGAGKLAAELQSAFTLIKSSLKDDYAGFSLKEADFQEAIKAFPNYKPEEAVHLHLKGKLRAHMTESRKRSETKTTPMVKANRSSKGTNSHPLGRVIGAKGLSVGAILGQLSEAD